MKDWLPLIGVIIAQVVIVMLFWMKLQADDKRRWNERRVDVYSRLAREAKVVWDLALVSNGPGNINWTELKEASDRFDDHMLDVDLLATWPTRDRANELQAMIDMLLMAHRGEPGIPMPENTDLLAARFAFETAARKELRVGRPTRMFVVEADSLTEFLWNVTKALTVWMLGRPGRWVTDRLERRVMRVPTPPKTDDLDPEDL